MSKDVMSKIRNGDVWKALSRVLSEHGIERPEGYEVVDERPHPKLVIRYCGIERVMHFAGTPSSRRTPRVTAAKLRGILREMQIDSIASVPTPIVPEPTRVKAIVFRGAVIDTIEIDGAPHVALKPIVEGMGLDWSAQHKRVARDPVLSEGMVVTTIPTPGGRQDVSVLPLKMLNGFLFGVDSARVRDEIREGVIAYQRECYDALAAYWLHAPTREPEPAEALSAKEIGGIVKSVTRAAVADLRQDMVGMMQALADQVRALPAPAPDVVPARDYVPALTVLEEMAGIAQTRRYRGLSSWASGELLRWCGRHGIAPKQVETYPGWKWLFPRSAAADWLASGGRDAILHRVALRDAQKRGQGVLAFARRTPPCSVAP